MYVCVCVWCVSVWDGVEGSRLSTLEAATSKVKVDFPNRHPRVSHWGTWVPPSLPKKQRLLSNHIEDTQGVQARVKFG